MGSRRRSYHHGNLREALIQAAREAVADGGASSLSLRSLASAVGVSHPAAYRHFADKQALLAEVARTGFEQLRERMESAVALTSIPLAQLQAAGLSYVEFAAEHRAIFRLMFGEQVETSAHPDLEQAATRAFEVMLDILRRCQSAGVVRDDDPRALGHIAWGLVHGLATLWVDGQLDLDERERLALAALANDVLYRGLQARPVESPKRP